MKYKKGSSLVEVLIAVSIITTSVISIVAIQVILLGSAKQNTNFVQAIFLLEEGAEGLKMMRDNSFLDEIVPLVDNTEYYLFFDTSSSSFEATSTATSTEGKFFRTVEFDSVNRDVDGTIVDTGGVTDPKTRKARLNVSWSQNNATTTKSVETYLYDLFEN
jgi:Tfp pilus assembly protein PilV